MPVLIDTVRDGRPRTLVYLANRNGFFYVMDRKTGALEMAREFAWQTWASGIDPSGRPTTNPRIAPTAAGVFVAPSANGATNWWPPAYRPATGLFYVMAYDGGATFFADDGPHARGEMYLGGTVGEEDPSPDGVSAVRAIDPATGGRRWEFPLKPKSMSGSTGYGGGAGLWGRHRRVRVRAGRLNWCQSVASSRGRGHDCGANHLRGQRRAIRRYSRGGVGRGLQPSVRRCQ